MEPEISNYNIITVSNRTCLKGVNEGMTHVEQLISGKRKYYMWELQIADQEKDLEKNG